MADTHGPPLLCMRPEHECAATRAEVERLRNDTEFRAMRDNLAKACAEVERLRGELESYADHAEDSGWSHLAYEIRQRLRGEAKP